MPVKSIERQIMDRGVLGNMPRWGKLRKGGEKPDGKIGKDLTYFRLTLEPEHEDVREAFEALFGTQPEVLHNVLIAADNADTALDYWYEEHAHARLKTRCDGEEIVLSFNEADFRYDTTPHKCTCNPLDRSCGLVGRLDIVIPALCDALGKTGKLTVLTGSVYDVTALRASMHIAGAFMQRYPDYAFWSVPFTIGRAMRTVPVTMTDKKGQKQRSNKPMSLLYAQVEPEFNQVLTKQLTAPAQLMLAGVNPTTGELPEVVIEQAAAWDRDYVNEQTLHLFDHENHQANAIDKLIADGLLPDDMGDEQAIQIITYKRQERAAEKQAESAKQKPSKNGAKSNQDAPNSSAASGDDENPYAWVMDARNVANLIHNSKLDMGRVVRAFQWVTGNYQGETPADFQLTKEDAWAACVCQRYDFDAKRILEAVGGDESNAVYQNAMRLMTVKDIPF